VTPMIGVNDSQNEIFLQKDARACTGALYKCTNVTQQPYEFAGIFAGYNG
jgi:hypothetical protein